MYFRYIHCIYKLITSVFLGIDFSILFDSRVLVNLCLQEGSYPNVRGYLGSIRVSYPSTLTFPLFLWTGWVTLVLRV